MKKFLVAGEACLAIFWPTPGFMGRTFHSYGFSTEGTLSFDYTLFCHSYINIHYGALLFIEGRGTTRLHPMWRVAYYWTQFTFVLIWLKQGIGIAQLGHSAYCSRTYLWITYFSDYIKEIFFFLNAVFVVFVCCCYVCFVWRFITFVFGTVWMYLWWSLCTLYLHACQVRVTAHIFVVELVLINSLVCWFYCLDLIRFYSLFTFYVYFVMIKSVSA